VAAAIGGLLIFALGFGLGAASGDEESSSLTAGTVPSDEESDSEEDSAPTTRQPTTTTEAPLPAPTDFTITLLTESHQCFGSAGCNVVVVPELTWNGPGAYSYDKPVGITYQIDGDESGPVIETIEMDTQGNYDQSSSVLSTASADVVPTATVTMVR
jgi:hypothetical protein